MALRLGCHLLLFIDEGRLFALNPSVVTSGVILEPEDEIKAQEQMDQAIRLMQVRFLWVKGEAIFTDYGLGLTWCSGRRWRRHSKEGSTLHRASCTCRRWAIECIFMLIFFFFHVFHIFRLLSPIIECEIADYVMAWLRTLRVSLWHYMFPQDILPLREV